MGTPTTVIVAARDEAERILATLAGIALALPGARVWVADDGSLDATAELARGAGARVVRSERPIGKGGTMSAAARRKISAAAKARWAKVHAAAKPAKKKRIMSAAGRAKISAAAKARWAKVRAEKNK